MTANLLFAVSHTKSKRWNYVFVRLGMKALMRLVRRIYIYGIED